VRPNGCIRWRREELYIGQVLAAEPVGVMQLADAQWQVVYGPVVLGTFSPGATALTRPRR
jgi:hypothetical protein